MFPDARNIIRRWSEYHHNKVPVPVAATLYNLMPEPIDRKQELQEGEEDDQEEEQEQEYPEQQQEEQKQQKQKPPPPPLVPTKQSKWFHPEHSINLLQPIKLEILEGSPSQQVVYSQVCSPSIQPSWEHLDERIELYNDWWNSDGDTYRSMKMRFTILSKQQEQQQQYETNDSKKNNTLSTKVLLELSVHPTLLQRLSTIPNSLPPNSCLIFFSDGSIRVTLSLFQLLLDHQLVEPPSSDIEDFSRFEDDVFRTLDLVTPPTGVPQRARTVSASSLLVHPNPDTTTTTASLLESEKILQTEEVKADDNQDLEISTFDKENEKDAILDDLKQEQIVLEELLAAEESLLKQEITGLKEEMELMKSILKEEQLLKQEIAMVQLEVKRHAVEVERKELLRETQFIRLIKELRLIYPISSSGSFTKKYQIRGLSLPADITGNPTTISDEEISAAMGFVCHLVFMMSKYLAVQLRHRLHCNSSRSAIQQDGNLLLPLFLSRSVEQEQVDRGMKLLEANVDCILKTRGIHFKPKSHILARLERVYDHIINGKTKLESGRPTLPNN